MLKTPTGTVSLVTGLVLAASTFATRNRSEQ
jgi:hypothetical protein